jgi:hypothetical protein
MGVPQGIENPSPGLTVLPLRTLAGQELVWWSAPTLITPQLKTVDASIPGVESVRELLVDFPLVMTRDRGRVHQWKVLIRSLSRWKQAKTSLWLEE